MSDQHRRPHQPAAVLDRNIVPVGTRGDRGFHDQRPLEFDRQLDPDLSFFCGVRQARPRSRRTNLDSRRGLRRFVVLDLLTLLGLTGSAENPSTLYYVVGIPVGLLDPHSLIDFGFRRGTVGPNRYGPDPLAAQ
jgi:hypothetical protein